MNKRRSHYPIHRFGIFFLVGFCIGIGVFIGYRNRPNVSLPKKLPSSVFTQTSLSEIEYIDGVEVVQQLKAHKTPPFMIVDIRSKAEFSQGHIRSAVNIPIYDDPNNIRYLKPIADAKELSTLQDKKVIVYGHSSYSILPSNVVKDLRTVGIDARVLKVGWNEWSHMQTLWLPESMWDDIHMEEYIVRE